jgi:hypothetical protein
MKLIYRPVLAVVLGGLGITVMVCNLTWLSALVGIGCIINAGRLLSPLPTR